MSVTQGTPRTPGQGGAARGATGRHTPGPGNGTPVGANAGALPVTQGTPPPPPANQQQLQIQPAGAQGGQPAPLLGQVANAAANGNPAGYLATFYTGQLPAARGTVATAMAAQGPPATQRDNAEAMYQFLLDPQNDLRDLNGDDSVFTAVVSIPASGKVKVIYGMGFGTAGIGQASPIQGKLLALYGEGGGILGPAQAIVLDATLRDSVRMKNLTDAEIEAVFQSGNHSVDAMVQRASNVQQESTMMKIAPIPTYMVWDGLDKDLDAAMVYERLRDCQHPSAMRTHALTFLRTCMVGRWRDNDEKPFLPADRFFTMLPPEARIWGSSRFNRLFPALGPTQTPATPPRTVPPAGPAPPIQQATQGGQGVIQMDADTLRQFLQAAPTAGAPAAVTPDSSKEDGTFKVSEGEKARMKRMCGIDADAGDECFPRWFRDIFAKHQDDISKAQLIAECIDATWILEDAEVPLYPALLKTIRTRNWTAQDLGKRAALVNAASGLSPFAMVDLTEDDIAEMTQASTDLANATSVSILDHKAARAKITAATPKDAQGFLLMLKRYTNLLFALFSAQSPLYVQMYGIVKALREYSLTARENLSHEVKTSILWIILLQSRWFAQGKMVGTNACLGEFTNMVNLIKAKNCAGITHDEVPSKLLLHHQAGSKRTAADTDTRQGGNPPADDTSTTSKKRQRLNHPHSKELAEFFKDADTAAGTPSLKRICEYCGITPEQLVPDLGPDDCRNHLVTGRCMFGSACKFHHRTATKKQIAAITSKLERYKKDPLGLKGEKPGPPKTTN